MSDGEQWKKQTQFNEEMREFMESMNTRFDELRTQVDSIYMMCKQSQQQRQTPLHSGVDPASAQKSASKFPDPEIIRHASYDTVKIPKLDFPTFDGVGPREWIRKCEQYFIIHSVSDDLKLRLGELHLRGEAELWLIKWKLNNPSMSMSWESLKDEVCNRFEVGALLVDEFGQQSPLKLEGSGAQQSPLKLEGSGATHNLFEKTPSLHSMKKNEANDNTEDGVLSFGEMLSVLDLKDEEIVNGSAIGSFKAWNKEVVPRIEVVWDQNVMWNDADQLFDEMPDSFSVKLDSGIDGYKDLGLSVVNFLRDLGYKDGVTEGLSTSQLMRFTKASCITEFEEVRVNHFNIANRNVLPLIDAGKTFHFNPGWEVETRHQVIKAHKKIQMQKSLTLSFSSMKNTTIVMVICQNQILEDLLGFLLSRFLTFMFDPGGGRNTSLQLVGGAIRVSNAIKRNSYHKGNFELITHVAVATVKLFSERSYLDWTYTSIRICPAPRDACLSPSIDSINHDNIVLGSTHLETIVEYLPHGREEKVGALVLTTVCVLKALKSIASFPVETLCNVFKLHAVRLVVQVIFNGEIDSFAPCCELTKYGTVAEAIATKEIFPRSKKIIFVMATTWENFIWDPGQCVISFYILEGKDVFERVGKRIIPMNITWVIMEVIKDVQNNCTIMRWYEMAGCLNTNDGYMLQMKLYSEGLAEYHLGVIAVPPSLPYEWSRYAQFILAIVDRVHSKYTLKMETRHWFNQWESDWELTSFLPTTENDLSLKSVPLTLQSLFNKLQYSDSIATKFVGQLVTVDVGTNNEDLFKDEFYIRLRHRRSTGPEYAELHEILSNIKQMYGEKVLIEFEDFAVHNACKILAKYGPTHLILNNDIHVIVFVILAGLRASLKLPGRTFNKEVLEIMASLEFDVVGLFWIMLCNGPRVEELRGLFASLYYDDLEVIMSLTDTMLSIVGSSSVAYKMFEIEKGNQTALAELASQLQMVPIDISRDIEEALKFNGATMDDFVWDPGLVWAFHLDRGKFSMVAINLGNFVWDPGLHMARIFPILEDKDVLKGTEFVRNPSLRRISILIFRLDQYYCKLLYDVIMYER